MPTWENSNHCGKYDYMMKVSSFAHAPMHRYSISKLQRKIYIAYCTIITNRKWNCECVDRNCHGEIMQNGSMHTRMHNCTFTQLCQQKNKLLKVKILYDIYYYYHHSCKALHVIRWSFPTSFTKLLATILRSPFKCFQRQNHKHRGESMVFSASKWHY